MTSGAAGDLRTGLRSIVWTAGLGLRARGRARSWRLRVGLQPSRQPADAQPGAGARSRRRRSASCRRFGADPLVLRRGHPRRGIFLRRSPGARPLPRRRQAVAARPRRFRLRRLRRGDHRGLFRLEEARRACRFPRTLPHPQCRGEPQHFGEHRQHRPRAQRRRQRQPVSALARRQSVRRRDVRGVRRRPPAAAVDQRLRHLQSHALRVRPGGVQRDVQRCPPLQDRRRGGGVRGGARRFRSRRAGDVSRRLRDAAAGMDRARAQEPRSAAAAARVCASHRALSRRLDEIREAARRRPRRQFRPFGISASPFCRGSVPTIR